MTYATTAEGLALAGRLGQVSSTSRPSADQCDTLNEGISAEIDFAVAAGGLSVPVTAPASLVAYLKLVNQWGFAWNFLKAQSPDAGGPAQDKSYIVFKSAYDNALKILREGAGLDEAANATVLPGGFFVANPDEEPSLGVLADATLRFETGKVW